MESDAVIDQYNIAWLETEQLPRLRVHVFNGLTLNPLDGINLPNKQSSTKRFRSDYTAIKLNHSTNVFRKRGKTTANYIVTPVLVSLWAGHSTFPFQRRSVQQATQRSESFSFVFIN